MEEPATTNSTVTKRTRTSTTEMTAVPLLQALLYQLRSDLNTTRMALDSERAAVRALKRDRAAEIKAVREEEAEKCRNLLSDLKSRYWNSYTLELVPSFCLSLGFFNETEQGLWV
jgi:hypothetical protein